MTGSTPHRHRLQNRRPTCAELGVEARTAMRKLMDIAARPEIANPANWRDLPASWTTNEARRHLTTKQRAALAAERATMKVGNPGKSRGSIASNDAITETEAAKAMDVSRASVGRAKKVMKEDPEAHAARL